MVCLKKKGDQRTGLFENQGIRELVWLTNGKIFVDF